MQSNTMQLTLPQFIGLVAFGFFMDERSHSQPVHALFGSVLLIVMLGHYLPIA